MGFYKAEKPMCSKVLVWPAIVIKATADPVEPNTLAQDATKSTAHPLVNHREGPFATMFEVFEPSPQTTIDVVDDGGKALAVATIGLGADRGLELVQAFLAGPSRAPLEMISKEIETCSGDGDIHQPGLFGMQSKSSLLGQVLQQRKCPTGFRLTPAQDHEVIRISDHLKSRLHHGHIDRMQIQVGKQRAYHGSLGTTFLRCPKRQILKDILLEKCFYQGQHSPVRNVLTDVGQQRGVRYTVEVRFEVRIHHMRVTCLEEALQLSQRVFTSASRSEPIALRDEYILEDRLDHNSQCSLDDSVPHTRYSSNQMLFSEA